MVDLAINVIALGLGLFFFRKWTREQMATFQELISEIDGMHDVVDAVGKALDGFADKIEQNVGTPAAVQAAVDELRTYKQALTDAIVRNTPVDPAKPEEPTAGEESTSGADDNSQDVKPEGSAEANSVVDGEKGSGEAVSGTKSAKTPSGQIGAGSTTAKPV